MSAPEELEECGICGDDHETRSCELGLCGKCGEILDNCGCENPEEITAEEWAEREGGEG